MKLSLVTCTDGTYMLRSEHGTRDGALMAYDDLHKLLISDTSMKYGVIAILDENLDCFEGRKDTITHPVEENNSETPTT